MRIKQFDQTPSYGLASVLSRMMDLRIFFFFFHLMESSVWIPLPNPFIFPLKNVSSGFCFCGFCCPYLLLQLCYESVTCYWNATAHELCFSLLYIYICFITFHNIILSDLFCYINISHLKRIFYSTEQDLKILPNSFS